jgi:hypothetical protein
MTSTPERRLELERARRQADPERFRQRYAESYRRRQESTLPAGRRYRPWQCDELELVQRTDIGSRELALLLDRSFAAVSAKKLDLRRRKRRGEAT